ncbi:hypothetical protein QAD02_009666 [Eretmocerus hayati]|uniref:Uncharacterized protein n=1 Tax=Eretmocerus hayati TaxID=131215 RepID=A0ACC2NA38_9HYME|nr:hypothetical protein QAD02_009666 [Eretmocerus hayati]
MFKTASTAQWHTTQYYGIAVLERSKSDRSSRSDENHRRRTIIVEKKNGSYGFTLQSYGIHYKREQEIEMVTYVDFVEYDGPAFRAGMREGDVILSINGKEMDRADHKTLVNFIKNCDSRMRMVVSFEDCVKKVELHMRYIELQRALQSRLAELERLCERERSILVGRWKTHSLPARKRSSAIGSVSTSQDTSSATGTTATATASSEACLHEAALAATANTSGSNAASNLVVQPCCRQASSTEHLLLYNVQADGRSFLVPRSAACLVSVHGSTASGGARPRTEHPHQHHHHFFSNVSLDTSSGTSMTASARHSYHQSGSNGSIANSNVSSKSKKSSGSKSTASHQQQQSSKHDSTGRGSNETPREKNSDSNHHQQQKQQPSSRSSLCVACISSARRMNRSSSQHQREQHHQQQQNQGDAGSLDAYDLASPCCDPHCVPNRRRKDKHRHKQQQHHSGSQSHQHQVWHHHLQQQQQQRHCSRTTGHSLRSLASSDLSGVDCTSAASGTTSLSTDTLYWDSGAQQQHQQQQQQQHRSSQCLQYAKPKSWDNLATKAFGGYGFGYGYLDTTKSATQSVERAKSGSRAKTSTSCSSSCTAANQIGSNNRRSSSSQQMHTSSSRSSNHYQPTKSTESLLTTTTYKNASTELDTSVSCDCLEGSNSRKQIDSSRHHHKRNDSCNRRRRTSLHADAKQQQQRSINGLTADLTRL